MYDHVNSINSITATVMRLRRRMAYLLMSDITYYKVSKPFFIVTESC